MVVILTAIAVLDWYMTKKYTTYVSNREYKRLSRKSRKLYKKVVCYSCDETIKPRRYYYNPYAPVIDHVCSSNICRLVAYD